MKREIILVLDSFGVGASKDAVDFGDEGANTLDHIAQQCDLGLTNEDRR
jgi:phosphopentomutase